MDTNQNDALVKAAKKLLDCPFCGASANLEERIDDLMDEIGEMIGPYFLVDCSQCPIQTYPQSSAEDAIKYWNTRQIEAERGKLVARLKVADGIFENVLYLLTDDLTGMEGDVRDAIKRWRATIREAEDGI